MGKSPAYFSTECASRNHPHGRGEELTEGGSRGLHVETPPRAWGRRSQRDRDFIHVGNTPTGVGKTAEDATPEARFRKHPHGRGEEISSRGRIHEIAETPPRAWGRVTQIASNAGRNRNTPTGVGKRAAERIERGMVEKHPHGRGEEEYSNHNEAI